MISKELFINTMERLVSLDTKMNAVDDAMHELSPDFCSFYIPETTDIVVDMLRDIFNDKNGWLGYFVFEKDFLRTMKYGDVKVGQDVVDVSSWGNVYDYLIKNMEE